MNTMSLKEQILYYESQIEILKQEQSGLDKSKNYLIGKVLVYGNALILCKEIVSVISPEWFILKGIYVNKKTLDIDTKFELTYRQNVTPLYYSKRSNKEEQEWLDDFTDTMKKCFDSLLKNSKESPRVSTV